MSRLPARAEPALALAGGRRARERDKNWGIIEID